MRRRATPRTAATAFTLIELLVVIAIVGVLGTLVLSVLRQVEARGRAAQCVSNLRQWGVALNLYANDKDGFLPRRGQGVQPVFQIQRPEDWFNALPPYVGKPGLQEAVQSGRAPRPGERSLFVCPAARASTEGQYFIPYAMNMYLSPWIRPLPHRRTEIENPTQLAFLADGPVAWSSAVPSMKGYSVQARHAGRANICFVDGHVASFSGDYLGCGRGEPNPPPDDVHWQTNTGGVNQTPVP